MANRHGQIARHGITIQAMNDIPIVPGWLGSYVNGAVGLPNTLIAAAQSRGHRAPSWVSNLRDGQRIFIHDLHRGYTRYPARWNQTIDLNLDTHLNGDYNGFNVNASVANVARASHRGLDLGAVRGNLSVRVRAWNTSGSLIHDWGNLTQGLFGGYSISGWTSYWNPWEITFNLGQPIGRVLVNTRIVMGSEEYHDVGDRSNGRGWNPNIQIGAFENYNYFDLIGINEGQESHRGNTGNALEYERRADVTIRGNNRHFNTISSRKNFI